MKATTTPLCEIRTDLTHPDAVSRRFLRSKPRRLRVLALTGLLQSKYVAFKQTLDVAWTVIMERVFYHIIDGVAQQPFRPTPEYVNRALSPAFNCFLKHIPFVACWSAQQFVDSYQGRKRGLYERAAAALGMGWTWANVRQWVKYRTFIKHEKLLVTGKRLVPRCIQPRDPRYNVLVGRYIKAVEKPIFHALQEMFCSDTPVVAKGVDVVQLGSIISSKWGKFTHPVAVGLDMSRFDQHISTAMLQYEHGWYNSVFHSKELAKLLKLQLRNSGTLLCNDGLIKYHIDGSRGSGDMNTSLGNSLIMASIVYSYMAGRCRYEVIINGDDTVVFVEQSDLHQLDGLSSFCSTLGFVLKVEAPVDVLERVSFCQMQPVFNGTDWVMVRSYPTCISKDVTITTSISNETTLLRFLGGVGMAGLALTPGIPVLHNYYRQLYQYSFPYSQMSRSELYSRGVGMVDWAGQLTNEEREIVPAARLSFWRAFGVLPDLQVELELKRLPRIEWDPMEESCSFNDAYATL